MIRLESLRAWHFKGLDEVALEDLAPDLNLVVGPNESGKSRLFDALRYALFERHKGQGYGKADLQGWWSDEAPEVEVAFRVDEASWRLHKRFLKQPFARLEGPGGVLRDDEAEARVRELLSTSEFDRKLEDRHLGIWPLLWLPQGEAGREPHVHLTEEGRGRLGDALSAEVDLVAAGERGQRLLERVEAEYERYWYKNGRPAREHKEAIEALDLAEAAATDAEAARDAAHAVAARLTAVRDEIAALAPRIDRARATRDEVRARREALAELEGRIEVEVARAEVLAARVQAAERDLAEREALEREVAARRELLAATDVEVAAAEARLLPLEQEHARAAEAVAGAERAEAEAEARLAVARRGRERREIERVRQRARTELAAAVALRTEVARHHEALRGLDVDALGVQRLRRSAEDLRVARARLEAASVLVRVHARRDLTIDGLALPAGETREVRVGQATGVTVEGLLDLEIVPRDGALARLADAVRDAEAAWTGQLVALGVRSAEEAEGRLAERHRHEERLKTAQARLLDHAPEGIDALEQAARDAEARLATLEDPDGDSPAAPTGAAGPAQGGDSWNEAAPPGAAEPARGGDSRAEAAPLFARGPAESARGGDPDRAQAAPPGTAEPAQGGHSWAEAAPLFAPAEPAPGGASEGAEAHWEQARTALAAARQRRDRAQEQLSAARVEARVLAERRTTRQAALGSHEARLAGAPGRDALAEAVEAARRARAEAAVHLQALRRRHQEAGGETIAAASNQAERALEGLLQARSELEHRRTEIRTRLEDLGGEQLHEALQDAGAALDRARLEHARVVRRAEAAARLRDSLADARRRTQERLLAPVLARVRPYLHEVFPDSELSIDEAWAIRGLRTAAVEERFDLLSGGAREQLSVAVRLALAEVLGRGERLPVVLDDALVNSDPDRLAAMLRVLYRASDKLQVLVFSCHEAALDALGASRVYRLRTPTRSNRPSPGPLIGPGPDAPP